MRRRLLWLGKSGKSYKIIGHAYHNDKKSQHAGKNDESCELEVDKDCGQNCQKVDRNLGQHAGKNLLSHAHKTLKNDESHALDVDKIVHAACNMHKNESMVGNKSVVSNTKVVSIINEKKITRRR